MQTQDLVAGSFDPVAAIRLLAEMVVALEARLAALEREAQNRARVPDRQAAASTAGAGNLARPGGRVEPDRQIGGRK